MESLDLEFESLARGQKEIWQLLFGFADSMLLKAAVDLGIPDIINSHGRPISLSQIASGIDSPSPDLAYLERIMRYLVSKDIIKAHHDCDHDDRTSESGGGETLYGLTYISKWLLSDSDTTLKLIAQIMLDSRQLEPWLYISQCVKEGGSAFQKVHGCELWDFASQIPDFSKKFNDSMACISKLVTKAVLSGYKNGFDDITTLVDVGGGTGYNLAEITKTYPHIKGINFDLPHVVATAPAFDGVSHVGGDMFQQIPKADVVFMKWILHDWSDEDCVRILKNCRNAFNGKTGKLVLVEIITKSEDGNEKNNNEFGDVGLYFDIQMLVQTIGGKERTEIQWKKLLEKGGFPRYNVIKIPALHSIIEAYPI